MWTRSATCKQLFKEIIDTICTSRRALESLIFGFVKLQFPNSGLMI